MKRILLSFSFLFFLLLNSQSQNINVTLADQLSYGSEKLSNIWHWKSPTDGKEYALVGAANGLSIVDVSNPNNVVVITSIPGPACTWREIRTNGNYAYITTECGTVGLQIVNLTNLPSTNLPVATWKPTISGTVLTTIHALQIDNGKIYLYGSNVGNKGAIVANITTNPMAPVYLGKYDPRYIHDGYVRNDTLYACHLYDGEVAMVNMSNPNNQTPMATFSTPNVFSHNTWLSGNSKVCFTTDEVNNSYLAAFDISNISNITELDRIQSNPGSNSVVHNTYIIAKNGGEFAVTSWYKDGFTIVDATRPHNMVQVGNYDTAPTATGSGMSNCWGVDPYLPSGLIVASDISNGLFVLSPSYIRACYLEGVVKDCATGNPISGYTATIQLSPIQSDAHIDITSATGQYAVGVITPGNYQVIFTKSGFPTLSYNVTLSTGVVTILDPMVNCPPFTMTGKVFNTANNSGVPFASVRIQSGSSVRDTITDINGNYSFPGFTPGTYEVTAGKWGFITSCVQNQGISAATGLISIGIGAGIYDDFTWYWGWTESGTATAGKWERGKPLGTTANGNPINPGVDVSNDCSLEAYVTGNKGVTSSDDDVDGGNTLLTSPYFNLTSYNTPYIYYSRWFYNASGNNTPNDTLKIKIDNGTVVKDVEIVTSNTAGNGTWVAKSFKVSNYVTPTSTMRIMINAEDYPAGNIVEGGFDKFYVLDSSLVATNNFSLNELAVSIFPNPINESSSINITGWDFTSNPLQLKLVDVFGREIQSMNIYNSKTVINSSHFASGIYFYRISNGMEQLNAGKLIVE